MTLPPPSTDRVLAIYLALNQYPILSTRIRARMRRELFDRGIVSREAFENEVREKAIRSQALEGLHDPFAQEPSDVWELRLARVRDSLTDFYFAYNFPYSEFERIVREIIRERTQEEPDLVTFNPELAPQSLLFEQAENIEKMPRARRGQLHARLQEIKVVLIRTMISDQLRYINIAKQWFTVADLKRIRERKIGQGKIGGKAAGMLLAERIIKEVGGEALATVIRTPESYFLGSDVMYEFMAANELMHWADQKYKPDAEVRQEYPKILQEFSRGVFPKDILKRLDEFLDEVGDRPLIVRSSSLLEDNFGTSFAGKYESVFCPNQGSREENLQALTQAIARVYASGLNPDALMYRHRMGLIDYDERIAILLQVVEGERFGRYYLPHGAGVAFSRNLYRWSPQIRQEDGFLRLVWGLGTRAVDQTGNDYPRLVALSHPLLHPTAVPKRIKQYSQQYVDVIDLEANAFRTLPVREVLSPDYAALRYVAQQDEGGYLSTPRSRLVDPENLVITFDELLRRTDFAANMKRILQLLEEHYRSPVDTEFALRIMDLRALRPTVRISLLQCRPQSHMSNAEEARLPANLPREDIIFSTRRMVPQGRVDDVRYVLFVTESYFSLTEVSLRQQLERAIGALNAALQDERYIAVGPGRWGTASPDLGVHIGYADIYNTRALIELSGEGIANAPEPSFGTHFFQDLMEANIYPLAIYLDDEDVIFRREFFYQTPNRVRDWIDLDERLLDALRLIDVEDYRPGHRLSLVMDNAEGRAVAFLQPVAAADERAAAR